MQAMEESQKKRQKSPRAPSIALDDAIERAIRIYEKERRHAAPTELIAQHIGYKSANNGTALSALASLRYYGLVERPKEGHLAVVKDVETYQYAPSAVVRQELVKQWLRSPPIFAELLDAYSDGLPSDANLRFDLINRGFAPIAAEALLSVFRRSVDFANYFSAPDIQSSAAPKDVPAKPSAGAEFQPIQQEAPPAEPGASQPAVSPAASDSAANAYDRIPVRLAGGRRAWLEIPSPFFAADKLRLKNQIDLLLTEEDENAALLE
jgi:hypothetical protein